MFRVKGDTDAALKAGERGLQIEEKALEKDDPRLATALTGLGWTFNAKGEFNKGLAYGRRAFAIRETALGAKHPNLSSDLFVMGEALLGLHRAPEALDALRRADQVLEPVPDRVIRPKVQLLLARATLESGGDASVAREYALNAAKSCARHPSIAASCSRDAEVWLAAHPAGH